MFVRVPILLALLVPTVSDGAVFSTRDETLRFEFHLSDVSVSCEGSPCEPGSPDCPTSYCLPDGTSTCEPAGLSVAVGELQKSESVYCTVELTGTLDVVIFVHPETGEPLPAESGGIESFDFPKGAEIVFPTSALEIIPVSPCLTSGYAESLIDGVRTRIEPELGECFGFGSTFARVSRVSGLQIPLTFSVRSDDTSKMRASVWLGNHLEIVIPDDTPLQRHSWQDLKSLFRK